MFRLVPEMRGDDQLLRRSEKGRELQQPEQWREGEAVKGRGKACPTCACRHGADAAEPADPEHEKVAGRKPPTHHSDGLGGQGHHHEREKRCVKRGGDHTQSDIDEQGRTAPPAQTHKVPAVNAEGLHVPLDPAAALAGPG
jgi:hypothetical protein